MGRDVRNEQTGDRNKFFKAQYVNQNKLITNAECEGVFYSTDIESEKEMIEWINGTQYKVRRVKIETKDFVTNLNVDDFVLYNDELWVVESKEFKEMNDNAKMFRRNALVTKIGFKK